MPSVPTKMYLNGIVAADRPRRLHGALSGQEVVLPDVNSGYPVATLFDIADRPPSPFTRGNGYPDTCSHRLKLGVLVPATNCTVEAELWAIIGRNPGGLDGVGIHTTPIVTPAPAFGNAAELEAYRVQFNANIRVAAETAMLAEPQYMILGFSMEHFSASLEENEAQPTLIRDVTGTGLSTWSAAADAALRAFGARRIGILCPFDAQGLANAAGFFRNLGYEVAAAVGLGCASGVDVGHIPDDYKEWVIRDRLLPAGGLDAIVQCGTNLSFLDLADRLEPEFGIPLIGINAATLWYAIRECGLDVPLDGASRLLREH